MGGILDFLKAAAAPAATARAGYLRGKDTKQKETLMAAMKAQMQASELERNSAAAKADRDRGDLARSQIGQVGVRYIQDESGNYIALPAKLPNEGASGQTPGTAKTSVGDTNSRSSVAGDASATGRGPAGPGQPGYRQPLDQNAGGRNNEAEEGLRAVEDSGPKTLIGQMHQTLGIPGQAPTQAPAPTPPRIGVQTGIKGPPRRIDPNSQAVIDARTKADSTRAATRQDIRVEGAPARISEDSTKNVNAQRVRVENPTPRAPRSAADSAGAAARTVTAQHTAATKIADEAILAANGDVALAEYNVTNAPTKFAQSTAAKMTHADYVAAGERYKEIQRRKAQDVRRGEFLYGTPEPTKTAPKTGSPPPNVGPKGAEGKPGAPNLDAPATQQEYDELRTMYSDKQIADFFGTLPPNIKRKP